ncbi:hypothetical protein [Methylobacterium sp. Leaf118]|uniref:hypothetical protein n=1 Tax=Methylobacterium sp. Leaf118 TaxID=2876562 RepID=UPI001E50B8BA|nr:hypothetical protein [Methylobacterium sp. Leaf118]
MKRAEPRRTPPVGKQLAAAKRQIAELMKRCGMVPVEVPVDEVVLQCDHDPALGLRDVCPKTGQHVPHQHDDRYLVFRPDYRHAIKTRGNGATTAGSDVGEMRKTRQLVEARVGRGEIAPDDPSIAPWAPPTDKRPTPKQQIKGASFPKAEPQRRASTPLAKPLPPRRSLFGGA